MMRCPHCGDDLGPRGQYAGIQFTVPKHFKQQFTQREMVREHTDYARDNGIELGRAT